VCVPSEYSIVAGDSHFLNAHKQVRNRVKWLLSYGLEAPYPTLSLFCGTAIFRNSRFEKNRAENGGALNVRWQDGSITIENSTFVENEPVNIIDGWGGAILTWDGAEAIVRDSEFSGNKAQQGCAVYNNFGVVGRCAIAQRNDLLLCCGSL
jgi:hypothetical protein